MSTDRKSVVDQWHASELERQRIDHIVELCIRDRFERMLQGVAEMRAQLRNEIAASEERSAYHAERRDRKLVEDLDRRLADFEQAIGIRRVAAPEQHPNIRVIAGRKVAR